MVGVLQQAWLRTGDLETEFPVSSIAWEELAPYIYRLDYFSSVETTDADELYEGYVEDGTNYISTAQFALITTSAKNVNQRLTPTSRKEYEALITYDVGTQEDRLAMSKPEALTESSLPILTSSLVTRVPGTDADMMQLFSAMVEYYSTTAHITRNEKVARMGLVSLLHPSRATSHKDFTWALMREVIFDGRLSYNHKELILTVTDFDLVAINLSRHLTKKAFDAFRAFLLDIGAPYGLTEAMTGKVVESPARLIMAKDLTGTGGYGQLSEVSRRVRLVEFTGTLPILRQSTSDDIASHNKLVEAYNRVHGIVVQVKEEKIKKEKVDPEKKREEAKLKLAQEMAAKKQATADKKAAAEKKREEAKKCAEAEAKKLARKAPLPKMEDEEDEE
jgi:hypothetical protein